MQSNHFTKNVLYTPNQSSRISSIMAATGLIIYCVYLSFRKTLTISTQTLLHRIHTSQAVWC